MQDINIDSDKSIRMIYKIPALFPKPFVGNLSYDKHRCLLRAVRNDEAAGGTRAFAAIKLFLILQSS